MTRYYVLGIEVFKMAQIHGIHTNKKVAQDQANYLKETSKNTCQRIEVLNQTQVNKQKLELF